MFFCLMSHDFSSFCKVMEYLCCFFSHIHKKNRADMDPHGSAIVLQGILSPGIATSTESRPGLAGSCFVDCQGTAHVLEAVQCVNGCLCFCIVCHFHEAETFAPLSFAVNDDAGTCNTPVLCKEAVELVISHLIAQVSNIQILGHYSLRKALCPFFYFPDNMWKGGVPMLAVSNVSAWLYIPPAQQRTGHSHDLYPVQVTI